MRTFYRIGIVWGISLLAMAAAALAQPSPEILWTRTYGGSSSDQAYSVQQTADGGYIVAGYTYSFGAGNGDFYLVKTNSSGDTLWTRTYGGSNDERAYSVQQTADGGYIVAGYTRSFGAGGQDFYLVKTNSQGDTLWTRTYGGSSDDYAIFVQQTADGGYVVAGFTSSFGAGGDDFYLVKTNSSGNTLWTRTYGGSYSDAAYSVQQTADGGYIVAGQTYSFGAGTPSYPNFWVVKTNSLGDTLWTRTYGGSGSDWAWPVQQTADGGYIVAGTTESFGAGYRDFYLVKTNSLGDTLWTRTYGGSNRDEAQSVQQTADGGYIVAGTTASFGTGDADLYLVKTGPDCANLPQTPAAPEVVITIEGSDARLNWDSVTVSIYGCPIDVTHYLVFFSEEYEGPYWYHGYTADTTYLHVGAAFYASGMFYNVTATTAPLPLLQALPSGEAKLTREEVLDILRR